MGLTLLIIGIIGVLINGPMLLYTVRRWIRYNPYIDVSDGLSMTKARIGLITIRRAVRLELVFFLCQLARLIHTSFVTLVWHESVNFPTLLERSLVTLGLIYLSLADLSTRTKLVPLLDRLHPLPRLPDAASVDQANEEIARHM